MDDRMLEIAMNFSEEERRVLRGYWKELFEYKNKELAVEDLEAKLKEGAEALLQFDAEASRRIEEKKKNPECSFCGKRASEVAKMFRRSEYLNICSECVASMAKELGGA